jgi:hypothetical protein
MEREKEEARKKELVQKFAEERGKERKRLEEEHRKREEEETKRRQMAVIQRNLQQLALCPAGFNWHQVYFN